MIVFELYLILQGALSPASPGVLERVANTRAIHFEQVQNWRNYGTLVAVADCKLLGRDGWLITDKGIERVLVVDCEQNKHKGQMVARELLADVNRAGLGHEQGWLVIK